MNIKIYILSIILFSITSCDNSLEERFKIKHLDDFLTFNKHFISIESFGFAANNKTDSDKVDAYCYLELDADVVHYFETDSIDDDPLDNSKYILKNFEATRVSKDNRATYAQGFIKFSRPAANHEAWAVISYKAEGKVFRSAPIKLKSLTQPTEYSDAITIDATNTLQPIFSWSAGIHTDTNSYLELMKNDNLEITSATTTTDLLYQYNNNTNVVKNITPTSPKLTSKKTYFFSAVGIGSDHWVNLWLEKKYIP